MKIPIVIALSVVGFLLGLTAVYMVLPKVDPAAAPDGMAADSLAVADSLTAADLLARALPEAAVDSLINLALPDFGTDSLGMLREQLAMAQTQIPALLGRLDDLERALAGQAERRVRAQELSGTLGRLDDGELRALLGRLDADVLADVYTEASPRNRTKLLQALPASRGASLVERIAAGDRRAIPLDTPPPPPSPAPVAAEPEVEVTPVAAVSSDELE